MEIDKEKSFRVESMAILANGGWAYTPVRRVYAMDADTLLIDSEGVRPNSSFIGYTEDSALKRVYNIVVDGGKAARIVDAPYPRSGLAGVVYEKSQDSLSLRSASCLDPSTWVWKLVSATDATAVAAVPKNSIIVKNNKVVGMEALEEGDHVRVMTDMLPEPQAGMSVTGYIVLVEK
jgi:hypothetical protein